jgi:hypothetical protein
MTPPWLLIVVHWLHVFFSVWWFGAVIVSRLQTWPALRRLGPEFDARFREEQVRGGGRRFTLLFAGGTIFFGILRGALGGAFERLNEPYGITYLAALVIGLWMLSWITLPWPSWTKTAFMDKVWVAAFPLIFTLMILMRFGL